MKITKRAVLYIGYSCNIRCRFCYYRHKIKKNWKNLKFAKAEASVYRKFFDNTRVDITGGEPTVYPKIEKLAQHCKAIGLRPSIITNGIILSKEKKVIELQKAGVFDYLISVHGLDEVYDYLVDHKRGFELQKKAVKNLNKHNIPFRINVTITKFNTPQLLDISKYAKEINAKIVNFICFNPFYEWENISGIDFQEKHSIIAITLRKALDYLKKNKIETNVRYFPFCLLKQYEEHQFNYPQLPYDSHEWDFMSWLKRVNPKYQVVSLFKKLILNNKKQMPGEIYSNFAFAVTAKNYRKKHKCENCSMVGVCDGLTKQYFNRFSDLELKPYDGNIIKDPTHYIKKQYKILD